MSTIGKRIRELREKQGISQDELAEKMGYKSRSTITKIESGKSDIPQSKIIKFAKALNTTPLYLMGLTDDNGLLEFKIDPSLVKVDSFSNRLKEAMIINNMKQIDLVNATGIGRSSINHYVSGKFEAKSTSLELLAKTLNTSVQWLLGYNVPMNTSNDKQVISNLVKIEVKKIPLLGTIAAGKPLMASEDFESYIELGATINADFALRVKGDSMINARILDGDLVFIKQQAMVDDGQIAAVLIDDEATLKRVYISEDQIMLVAENPSYKPLIYKNDGTCQVQILGKAVAFQSDIN